MVCFPSEICSLKKGNNIGIDNWMVTSYVEITNNIKKRLENKMKMKYSTKTRGDKTNTIYSMCVVYKRRRIEFNSFREMTFCVDGQCIMVSCDLCTMKGQSQINKTH